MRGVRIHVAIFSECARSVGLTMPPPTDMAQYKRSGSKSVVFNVLEILPVGALLQRLGRYVAGMSFARGDAHSVTSGFFAGVG